jgi:two-component system, chemotaxis family, sensor kinase Cph1
MASSPGPYQTLFDQEEKPRQRAEELVRSHAELQAFAYTAAHELKEPLRTIRVFTQLLVRRVELDEADREVARFIVDGVQCLSALVDDMLSSAVQGFVESLDSVELDPLATQAIANLREAITLSGATINVGPLPVVEGRAFELTRLFQNLISNAIKYRNEAAAVITITSECAGPEWIIKVRDNGVGIAKDQQRRIFGLFSRMPSDTVPGTGVGLAVCKRIVEGQGGTIWVESEIGLGSTFCFHPGGRPPKGMELAR